jgi:hypothetical protein
MGFCKRKMKFWQDEFNEYTQNTKEIEDSFNQFIDQPALHFQIPQVLCCLRTMGMCFFMDEVREGYLDTPISFFAEFFQPECFDEMEYDFSFSVLARNFGQVMTLAEEILGKEEIAPTNESGEKAAPIIPVSALRPFLTNPNIFDNQNDEKEKNLPLQDDLLLN